MESDSIHHDGNNTDLSHNKFQRIKSFCKTHLKFCVKDNHNWGYPLHKKANNQFRIFFQNINSIYSNKNKYTKWDSCCEIMQDLLVDIFGFAETCVDCKNKINQHKIRAVLNQHYKTSSTCFSINSFPTKSNYLPGGNIQVAAGHWGRRVEHHIDDPKK
jgi:hypothetical protein